MQGVGVGSGPVNVNGYAPAAYLRRLGDMEAALGGKTSDGRAQPGKRLVTAAGDGGGDARAGAPAGPRGPAGWPPAIYCFT